MSKYYKMSLVKFQEIYETITDNNDELDYPTLVLLQSLFDKIIDKFSESIKREDSVENKIIQVKKITKSISDKQISKIVDDIVRERVEDKLFLFRMKIHKNFRKTGNDIDSVIMSAILQYFIPETIDLTYEKYEKVNHENILKAISKDKTMNKLFKKLNVDTEYINVKKYLECMYETSNKLNVHIADVYGVVRNYYKVFNIIDFKELIDG